MDPSGLGSAPNGEMWFEGKGGEEKGPAVCFRRTSFSTASLSPSSCSNADLLLRGAVSVKQPRKPMSKPFVKP